MARNREHRKRPEGGSARGGPCAIKDCQIPAAAMGLCWGHYRRQLRGSPVGVDLRKPEGAKHARAVKEGPRSAPYSVRRRILLEWYLREGLVTPEPNTGCLLWLGNYNAVTGYPVLGYNADGERQRDPWGSTAHRAALYFSGVNLEHRNMKLHARHACNNPGCVAAAFNAPVTAHVVYGTAKENMADRTLRYRRGELKRSRLPARLLAYVREAHALGVSKAELARDLGVAWGTIHRAIRTFPINNQQAAQAA